MIMIFQLSDWFPKPMIWAIIVKFDQIRKNGWRISCAEVLEVGKIFFAASSVKKIGNLKGHGHGLRMLAWPIETWKSQPDFFKLHSQIQNGVD